MMLRFPQSASCSQNIPRLALKSQISPPYTSTTQRIPCLKKSEQNPEFFFSQNEIVASGIYTKKFEADLKRQFERADLLKKI